MNQEGKTMIKNHGQNFLRQTGAWIAKVESNPGEKEENEIQIKSLRMVAPICWHENQSS